MVAAKNYIFSYGSLVNRPGMERTLGRSIGPDEYFPAKLSGWRREWSLLVDNMDPRIVRYFIDPSTGRRAEVLTRVLDVVPHAGAHVNGVVYAVNEDEIADLDEREDIFERVDVTSQITRSDSRPTESLSVGRFTELLVEPAGDNGMKERCRHEAIIAPSAPGMEAFFLASPDGCLRPLLLARYDGTFIAILDGLHDFSVEAR